MGYVEPLIHAVNTNPLSVRSYRVDDPVNLSGARVWGQYGLASGTDAAAQPDWETIDITAHSRLWPWRWVNNNNLIEATFPVQNPGVLLQIGTWGNLDSTIPGGFMHGLRIAVDNLWAVETIEWDPEPNFSSFDIFFDDPTMIGIEDDGFLVSRWIEALGDSRVKIVYDGNGADRHVHVRDFAIGLDPQRVQWGGFGWFDPWGSGVDSGPWHPPTLNWFSDIDPVTREFIDCAHGNDDEDMWTEWVTNRRFQRVSVTYRNQVVHVRVPMFSRLEYLEIESLDPPGGTPVMNGRSWEDAREDGEPEFFQKVRVSAVYSHNIDEGRTGTRPDLMAAFAGGRIRWDGTTRPIRTNVMDETDPSKINDQIFNLRNSRRWEEEGTGRAVRVFYEPRDPNMSTRAERRGEIIVGQRNYTD
jgi:hypothetical protein